MLCVIICDIPHLATHIRKHTHVLANQHPIAPSILLHEGAPPATPLNPVYPPSLPPSPQPAPHAPKVWINPSTGVGGDYLAAVESLAGGSPELTIMALLGIFAVAHSGLAGLRPYGEQLPDCAP